MSFVVTPNASLDLVSTTARVTSHSRLCLVLQPEPSGMDLGVSKTAHARSSLATTRDS